MLTTFLALISLGLYTGAGAIPAYRLARGPEHSPGKPTVLLLGAAAVLLHGAAIYFSIIQTEGLYFEFFGAASTIGWLMALLTLIALIDRPAENLAILVLPLAGFTAVLGSTLGGPLPNRPALPTGLGAHVYSSMLAYSVLAIAALQAVLVALQDHKLHHKHPGGFVRLLPPLQTMEALLFQMLRLGFVLLTAGLITGFIFLEDMFAQHVAHKTVLSIIAWFVFGTLLAGHRRFGWRGQIAIRWTIAGFIVLMLAFFGSKLVLEQLLYRA
jgi:ABC-type uncharacterized transport system permease subunit